MSNIGEHDDELIKPYGGHLVNLLVEGEDREIIRGTVSKLPRVQLTERNLCDLELLATGGFSPLTQFLGQSDYIRVLEEMRLSNGALFPLPITLPVRKDAGAKIGDEVALTDRYNNPLAIMYIEEIYEWDKKREAHLAYGTTDPRHPLISEMNSWGDVCISGRLRVLALPRHYDFNSLRIVPAQARQKLMALGSNKGIAFQVCSPLLQAGDELSGRAPHALDEMLLLHSVVNVAKPGDIDQFNRVRSHRIVAENSPNRPSVVVALLPLAMRMAGPREALWHAVIGRNFGANYLIVKRNYAALLDDPNGRSIHTPYDVEELLKDHRQEIGVKPLLIPETPCAAEEDRFENSRRTSARRRPASISRIEGVDKKSRQGPALQCWFTGSESVSAAAAPPTLRQQGFCLWLTGLSGAGKSTIANILTIKLLEHGRQITLLDGDVVRVHLSKGLGFSKEDRDTNVRRIGFVASEIVRHGGGVICAVVSPYRAARNECRSLVGGDKFIEIFVNTPLNICERRDVKGLYRQAREGRVKSFTGIDDIYEPPLDPEIVIDTITQTAEESAETIIAYLMSRKFMSNPHSLA
jgi:sulfate adenylyltransferase